MTIRATIFGKVLVWFGLTLGLSFVAFFLTTAWMVSNAPQRPFPGRLHVVQLEEARRAYSEGGPLELAEELLLFQQQSPGQYNLVDRNGMDLVTGSDLSAVVKAARSIEPPWRRKGSAGQRPSFFSMLFSGPPTMSVRSPDGEFTLLAKPRATLDPWRILPYYLSVVFVVILFSYGLAMHFVKPIRELRTKVAQFGEGSLGSRIRSHRRDELGDLSRDFDSMADRIENLLLAERRLLQDVSHELRSPLARIGFAVELARTGPDPAAAFARIKEELARLTALVGGLLQVTRVEGDPSARETRPVNLTELVNSIAADCAIEADVRHCRIGLVAPPAEVVVSGDEELLRRAIENVVRNAIRHTADGSAVEVKLTAGADSAAVEVRDHGTGIPEEMLPDIFKPFFRVESHRNRASGGIGLGLAIAERAVRAHSGRISAANAAPGLRVTISLPLGAGNQVPNVSLHKSRLPAADGTSPTTSGGLVFTRPGRADIEQEIEKSAD